MLFLKVNSKTKVLSVLLTLTIFTSGTYAGSRTGGSSSRGSSGRGSSSRGSSGKSSSSSGHVAKPSYSSSNSHANQAKLSYSGYNQKPNPPKQQHATQTNSAPYPAAPPMYTPKASPPYKPAPSAPALPNNYNNPAYKPGVAPVYPNQQRPPYGAVPAPQHHQPNYAAGPTQHQQPNFAAAPSHFQQPGYGAASPPHYQQPHYGGQPHAYPAGPSAYHPPQQGGYPVQSGGYPVGGYAGQQQQSGFNNFQNQPQQKSKGLGLGTAVLAGAASGVAGAALYNALTPSHHGSSYSSLDRPRSETTIIREVERPSVEVERTSSNQAAPELPQSPQQTNQGTNQQAPNQQGQNNVQNGFPYRPNEPLPPHPIYCDEYLPTSVNNNGQIDSTLIQPSQQPALSETTQSTVLSQSPSQYHNQVPGCIVRTPYAAEDRSLNVNQPPPYYPMTQNGYFPNEQENGYQTNLLNQPAYAPDDRPPLVDRYGMEHPANQKTNEHVTNINHASVKRIPFVEMILLLVTALATRYVSF